MYRAAPLWLVLAIVLFAFDPVQSTILAQKKCDLSDSKCLLTIARKVYKAAVTGVKDLIEPIDPLYVEYISGNIETLNYRLKNVTLSGMRHCEVEWIKYNENLTYEYHLRCPQIVFEYYYELEGTLAGKELEGAATCKLTIDDYFIKINGRAEKVISDKDQKQRLTLKEFHVDTDIRGNLTLVNTKIIEGDEEKLNFAVGRLNSRGKEIDKYVRPQLLEGFLALFIKTIDKHLNNYPLDELLLIDQ